MLPFPFEMVGNARRKETKLDGRFRRQAKLGKAPKDKGNSSKIQGTQQGIWCIRIDAHNLYL